MSIKNTIYSISFAILFVAFGISCSQNDSYIEEFENIIDNDSDTTNNDTISSDSVTNGYRIYEYDVEAAASSDSIPIDISGWRYKKAYFDNKGILITSATGNFGANDTIMLHSNLYQSRALLYTNENNDIYRAFDGKYLLDIYYRDNGDYTIFCFKEKCDSILFSIDFESEASSVAATRGVKGKKLYETLNEFAQKYDRLGKSEKFEKEHPFYSYLIDKAKLDAPIASAKLLANALAEFESNPELHNQKIFFNSIDILLDLKDVYGTAVGGALSGGALWAALGLETAELVGDYNSLVNEIFLRDGLYDKYKRYYKEKYSIYIHTNEATNITSKNATLNGTFYCAKNIGRTYFRYWIFGDDTTTIKEIDANITGNSLSVSVGGLSPNTEYVYYTVYECIVDGMKFTYVSDDYSNFKTSSWSMEAVIADVKIDSVLDMNSVECYATAEIEIKLKDTPQELLPYLFFSLSCKNGNYVDYFHIRSESSDTTFTISRKCHFYLTDGIDEIDYENFVATAQRQLDLVAVLGFGNIIEEHHICSSYNFEFRYDEKPYISLEEPQFIESYTEKIDDNDERNFYICNHYKCKIQCNGKFWFNSYPLIYKCYINANGEKGGPEYYGNLSDREHLIYNTYFYSDTDGLFCGYCNFPATTTYYTYEEYWIEGLLKNGSTVKSNVIEAKNEHLLYYCPHIW